MVNRAEVRRGCEEAKVKRKWNKALTKLGVVKTYYCDVNLEMKVPFQKKKKFFVSVGQMERTHCKWFFG